MVNLEKNFATQSADWPTDRKAAYFLSEWGFEVLDRGENILDPNPIYSAMSAEPYNIKPVSQMDKETYKSLSTPQKLNALALEDVLKTAKINPYLCGVLSNYARFDGKVNEGGQITSELLASGYKKVSDASFTSKVGNFFMDLVR